MNKKRTKAGTSKAEAAKRRALFVEAMVNPDFKGNATKAAIAAGFPKRSAAQRGHELVKDREISKVIKARRSEVLAAAQKKTGLSTERVLRELEMIVYSDLRKCFDPATGALLPPHLWPDDVSPHMASVKVVEMAGGMAVGGEESEEELEEQPHGGKLKRRHAGGLMHVPMYTKEVKLWDKNAAIEKAMKYLGMFERDNEQKPPLALPPGTKTVRLDFSKVKARVRAAGKRAGEYGR